MAPTNRIDETGDDDGIESADLRVPNCANPFRVSHGAAHSHGACESLTGLSGCRKNIEQGAAFSDMGYEYNTAMPGNPLILREKRSTARSSTFPVDASFLLLFRPVSGCYGSKMGAGRARCVRHEPAPAVRCPSMAVTDFSTLPRDARLLSAMSARLVVMRGGA